MRIKKSFLQKLIAFLSATSICFCYYSLHFFLWALILLLLLVLAYSNGLKIPRYRNTEEWIFLGLFWILGALYSNDPLRGLKYSVTYVVIICTAIMFTKHKAIYRYFIKYLYIESLIHVVATILRQIKPEMVDAICKRIMPASMYALQSAFINAASLNGNLGITTQTGWNAFYLLIAFCISISYLLVKGEKRRWLYLCACGSSFVSILLTNKRSYLVATIVVLILFFLLYGNIKISKKKFWSICGGGIAIVVGATLAYRLIPELGNVFNKIVVLGSTGSLNTMSSGRINIYQNMIEKLASIERILFGYGTGSTYVVMGIDGHNIYLQLLFENGILVALLFVYVFVRNILNAAKAVRGGIKENVEFEECVMINFSFCIQIAFLIIGLLANPLYDTPMFFLYLVLVFLLNVFKVRSNDVVK